MMRDRTAAALIAEAFGTFLFFFVGAGSVVLRDYLAANGLAPGPGLLGVALAHGLALAVLVSALGAVSGGHFNPAVTLGVWIMGKITPSAGCAVRRRAAGRRPRRRPGPEGGLRRCLAGLEHRHPALGAGISPPSGSRSRPC